jgi:hypothetical protein
MNENITGRKDWFFEPHPEMGNSGTPLNVVLEEEGRRLIEVVLPSYTYPLYYIQKPYINPNTGEGHWIDVHYDRSKNKMMRAFRFNTYG